MQSIRNHHMMENTIISSEPKRLCNCCKPVASHMIILSSNLLRKSSINSPREQDTALTEKQSLIMHQIKRATGQRKMKWSTSFAAPQQTHNSDPNQFLATSCTTDWILPAETHPEGNFLLYRKTGSPHIHHPNIFNSRVIREQVQGFRTKLHSSIKRPHNSVLFSR